MDKRYTISWEPGGDMIRYAIRGFWDVTVVDAFCAALRAELRRTASAGKRPRVLADASSFAVQTPAVTAAFEAAMFRDIVPNVERLAILVGSTLAKLQVERGAVGGNLRTFLHEADALAWLHPDG